MNSIGIQLRISDLLFSVQKRWKIIASLTFLGAVFGVLLSGMNYVQSAVETYQINGSFVITAVNSQGRYSGDSIAPNRTDLNLAVDLYDTVYYLLRSDRLLYQVINDNQLLGVSVNDIRSGLSISQYNETNIISMRLTWDNGEEGLMLWQAIVDTANQLMPQIMQVGRLRIFNEAEARLISSRTANIKTWMVLPVLGFAAGMGFAVIELLMRPTLINVKDVETVFGLETIGIIPYDTAYFGNKASLLVADERANSEVTQNFSSSAYILRNRIGIREKCHVFYITSTTGQEGRTTTAANLAIQLSDMERHTLLIDFDSKNPMLGSLFLNNLDYNRSLNALYRGEIALTDAITTLTGYLDILPMVMEHNLIYMDSTIIDMIAQLREQYQYIIIDAPPVGKEAETLSLNQVADTALFVVRYDTASIPEIQASLEKMDKSGIRILGCMVTGLKSSKNVIFGTSKEEAEKNAKSAAKQKNAKKKKQPSLLSGIRKDEMKEDEAARQAMTGGKKKKKKTGKVTKGKKKASAEAKSGPLSFFSGLEEKSEEPKRETAGQGPSAMDYFGDLPETPPAPVQESAGESVRETPEAPSPAPAESEHRQAEMYGDLSDFGGAVPPAPPPAAPAEAPSAKEPEPAAPFRFEWPEEDETDAPAPAPAPDPTLESAWEPAPGPAEELSEPVQPPDPAPAPSVWPEELPEKDVQPSALPEDTREPAPASAEPAPVPDQLQPPALESAPAPVPAQAVPENAQPSQEMGKSAENADHGIPEPLWDYAQYSYPYVPGDDQETAVYNPSGALIVSGTVTPAADGEPLPIEPIAPPKAPEKKKGLFARLFAPKAPAKAKKEAKAQPDAGEAKPKPEKKAKAKPEAETKPKEEKKAKAKPTAEAKPAPEKKPKAKPTAEAKPAPEKKAKAKPAAEAKPAPEKKAKAKPAPEKKAKAEPAKKEKSGLLPWSKSSQKKPDPFENIQPEAKVIKRSRNPFDDLMDDGPKQPTVKSDADVMEELMRMGLDGSWDKPQKEENTPAPAPKSGKRNPFDDL